MKTMETTTRHYFTESMREHDRAMRAARRKAAAILMAGAIAGSAILFFAIITAVALFTP